jgi:hypothetical protein
MCSPHRSHTCDLLSLTVYGVCCLAPHHASRACLLRHGVDPRENAGQVSFPCPEVLRMVLTDVRIPLNDDRKEKANRLHSRQAQHEIHMNQIKLAATPLRKRRSINTQSPRTPADGEEGLHVSGSAVTPMKRVPILANFEEWMKLATDNVGPMSLWVRKANPLRKLMPPIPGTSLSSTTSMTCRY